MAHFKLKDQALSVGDPKPVKQEKKKPTPLKRTAIKKKAPKKSNHVHVYMDFFGYEDRKDSFCEIPHCGVSPAEVHHIECRGMGGTTHEYTIEELMGLCRRHHDEYGDKKQWKEFLNITHQRFIDRFKPI